MRHQIRIFEDTTDEGWVSLWIVSLVVGVLGFVAALFISAAWPLTFPLFFFLLSYGIFGHVFWPLDTHDVQKYRRYRGLPAEHRKHIDLSPRAFAGMTSAQRNEFVNNIAQIETLLRKRDESLALSTEVRLRLQSIIEREKEALRQAEAVKAELKERGWDE